VVNAVIDASMDTCRSETFITVICTFRILNTYYQRHTPVNDNIMEKRKENKTDTVYIFTVNNRGIRRTGRQYTVRRRIGKTSLYIFDELIIINKHQNKNGDGRIVNGIINSTTH
jgi:hypothetical protein